MAERGSDKPLLKMTISSDDATMIPMAKRRQGGGEPA
jgi:hypothetical protein